MGVTSIPVLARGVPASASAGARVSRRIQALAIDLMVQGSTLVVLLSALELMGGHRARTGLAFLGWLAVAVLYEPAFVSRRGATLGHMSAGLRVVDQETGGHPDPFRAFVRFWLKATSGVIALAFVVLSREHQALHDVAAGTCVEEY